MIPTWIYAAIVAACVGLGAAGGARMQYDHDTAKANAEKLAAAAVAKAQAARAEKVTQDISTQTAFRQHEIAEQNATLYTEITKYVPIHPSATAVVHAVRVLNDAAASGLPVSDATGAIDDSPDAAQNVATLVTENIGQCRADLDRFAKLQQWLTSIQTK